MGNSNRSCPFLKQTEIQIGICKGGQVNDKKIAIVPYVTNGRNSQVGHDGHFNIFKKREVLY